MNITGGIYNRQRIKAPDENITRPTLSKVRMSVFNTLAAMTNFSGKSFLDMYSGSGIMSLEAVSRGFETVVAIEQNKKVYSVIKSNFSKYEKFHDLKLILGDSLKVCAKLNQKFDVIYIDPPYFSGIYEKSLDCVKNMCKGIIILEHVTDIEIPRYFKILKQKKYGDKFITFLSYNS
ncbi:16S rRNA (guanine(966)-N(2))-methyltransferase RsmD [bacterium]|nr:16S rRNA (guanine(966)-N(2))-methyltransferase RsmD [bacterium]